jgi:hypothetical protein
MLGIANPGAHASIVAFIPRSRPMPPPFQRLSVRQFADVLQAFNFTRKVTAVHMHHTWRPDHSMWRGERSMEGMWRSHTVERKFSDIAQHLTIDPEGMVWTGRNWNNAPASAVGHNGNSVAGPFMFEIVGNFDLGGDALAGAQRQAVLDVITLVNRRFGLDPETLLFHNQVAAKSCPGSAINRAAFVAEVRAHVPSTDAAPASRGARSSRAAPGSKPMPLSPEALAGSDLVARTVALIGRGAGSRSVDPLATPMEELDYSFDSASGAAASRGLFGLGGSPALTPEDIDALRPHVVNLRMGKLSASGLMSTDAADIDAILFEHAAAAARESVAQGRPFRLMLHAHGGLVKESTGLRTAQQHVGWWRDNGVYPIHFVWETGAFETLKDLITRARAAAGGSRGVLDIISDHVTDPLIERGARALQAERIWGAMKASALIASMPGGGALLFLERLAEFCKQFNKQFGPKGGSLELHASGHSAGSIFMAHLLHAAAGMKALPGFGSLQLMAPAIRADLFKQLTLPLVGKSLDALTVYTMRRDFERADDCAKVYRKSLLYLVSAACEAEVGAPILGLEDSLRADAALRAFFGLGSMAAGAGTVVWSRSTLEDGRSASRAVHHGDFDNDAPTMESIARRVLGLDDTTPLARRFPSGGARGVGDPWADGVDWPPEFPPAGGGGAAPVAAAVPPAAPAPALQAPAARDDDAAPAGRKLALCVGIDTYPTAPLAGCVNDARLWQDTLSALGFEVKTLFNEQAARDGLLTGMRELFEGARSGDEIVFQFAGHGTQVDDSGDGDPADREDDGKDEALCPHDFAAGPLVLDDEIAALINGVATGVRVTMFMDCCHSGGNSRVAPTPGLRARGIRLSEEAKKAHAAWRAQHPDLKRALASRKASRSISRSAAEPTAEPIEVNFSAAQSHELAWESEGHGEFTLRTTRLLAQGGAGLAPEVLHNQVLEAFGPQRRQTPEFKAPVARRGRRLFRA